MRDLGGNFNLNLQVSTDQGALVVRVSPEWVEADRLAAVQAVREYLRGQGWPIPQSLCTRTRTTLAQLHGRLVEVEHYIEPRGTSMTTRPAISAGIQWPARLHEDLRAAPTSPAAGRRELTALRGPQYEWALRLLSAPGWRTAFS